MLLLLPLLFLLLFNGLRHAADLLLQALLLRCLVTYLLAGVLAGFLGPSGVFWDFCGGGPPGGHVPYVGV